MKLINILIVLLLFSWVLIGSSGFSQQAQQPADVSSGVDFENQVIWAVGDGRPSPYFDGSIAQKLIHSMEEARAKAYQGLAMSLGNLKVHGEITLANGYLIDSKFKMQVDELVKHAYEIDSKRFVEKDGSVRYRSKVVLFLTGNNSLNSILMQRLKQNAENEKPRQFTLPSEARPEETPTSAKEVEKYTGLVIDVREFTVFPAMAPRIFAEDGREVYGTIKVSTDWAVKYGVVGYTKNIRNRDVIDRVGEHPLIIKAKAVKGTLKADIVVSDNDAGKILWADQIGDFLPECRVIFWLK